MKKDSKRLIISDLDGTLLNNKGELSKKTIATVKKVVAAGHVFCISTGRPYRSAIKYYKQLELTTIMSNVNGGYISNPSNPSFYPINNVFNKEILFNLINDKIIKEKTLTIYVETQQGGIIFYKNGDTHLSEDVNELFHIDAKDVIKINIDNKEEWNIVKGDIYSILINIDKKCLDIVSFAIKSFTTTLFVDYWKNPKTPDIITLDIRTVFQNKGSALEFMACYYGIPFRNTYAFGDGRNDIDMMKFTTRSYAMKNGHYAVKMASYKITTHTNDEDGVARQLIKSLINQEV